MSRRIQKIIVLVSVLLIGAAVLVKVAPMRAAGSDAKRAVEEAVARANGPLAEAATLGNYGTTTVGLSGQVTVTPTAAPTNLTRISVSTSTNFKGTFTADPATGAVRVTDAHPSGTYTAKVWGFNSDGVSTTKTFTLKVQTT